MCGSRVLLALAVSHLVVRISFLTLNLCVIAAPPVQLKAVVEKWALYMVFYYLTRPPFAVKVGETLRCELEFEAGFSSEHLGKRSEGTSLVNRRGQTADQGLQDTQPTRTKVQRTETKCHAAGIRAGHFGVTHLSRSGRHEFVVVSDRKQSALSVKE